jgi:SOS-response transcriptional repressor LexA
MGDLTDYDAQLLDTAGEALLQHVEKELNPVRSYKMVVLKVLLDDSPEHTEWRVEWIAQKFTEHYLANLEQLADCSVLARADAPQSVPLAKIVGLLKWMPLNYLSNTTADFFTFNRGSGVFALKPEVVSFWRNSRFRELLKERVTYALIRYFMGKGIDLSEYGFDPDGLSCREETKQSAPPPVVVTSLPFYPTLRIAAGAFREGAAEYEGDYLDVPDPRQRFRADRHFVAKIDGNSMDGGGTPILNGDLVILERIDSSRAGSLTAERAIAVEFRDSTGDTAYALKNIRKDGRGHYWLHSWNRTYDDAPVDPETMVPFARLIEKLGETP